MSDSGAPRSAISWSHLPGARPPAPALPVPRARARPCASRPYAACKARPSCRARRRPRSAGRPRGCSSSPRGGRGTAWPRNAPRGGRDEGLLIRVTMHRQKEEDTMSGNTIAFRGTARFSDREETRQQGAKVARLKPQGCLTAVETAKTSVLSRAHVLACTAR